MASTTVTRRRWLAGAAAALAPLVLGGRASAAPYEPAPSNGSKAKFKRTCDKAGGTFDAGEYSTACTYPTGDMKVCDENGQNCTWHEAQAPAPGPFADPIGALDPLPVLTEQPAAEPTGAAPKAKRGKKGGKRRKR